MIISFFQNHQLIILKISSNGRIKIEEKDEMKKRLGRSPDDAEGLCLAVWAARPEKPETLVQNLLYKEIYEYRKKQRIGGGVTSRL